ncbi:fructokinase [Granulicatella balaenopterae]|uniref:Fructokinase n=1 Tax=Granulicatella balaenopterae TaxID=137733 RepID=A0A1H9KED3_9LACT|nr:ROK family protein [Granulicatella balaenopterae]SEQ97223.1 fructokinase [Granulicatella balaenopterae]
MLFGSIEAGGTKFVCAIGNEKMEILERVSIETREPEATIKDVCEFFAPYNHQLDGVGVGSFGPIDGQKSSKTYGHILASPKVKWQGFDLIGALVEFFNCPIEWTTDVNAAAFGEYHYGHGKDSNSLVYYTIGTGIGAGAIQDDQFIGGVNFTEMGHMLVTRHPEDTAASSCPFHHNCLEGVASGPAIGIRAGKAAQLLEEDDYLWDIEAEYIAQCVHNTTLMLAPEVIVLGGGVMQQEHLLPKVKKAFEKVLNGYVTHPTVDEYIKTPKLGNNAATIGCFVLAQKAFEKAK